MMRRSSEAAQRAAERRKRENDAVRLRDAVPRLLTLRLEINEHRGVNAGTSHIRRIVVDNAPALFEILCSDHSCRDGGHDLTGEILAGLKGGAEQFEGEHVCYGQLGTSRCDNVLNYRAVATYRSA
jgi:hypothetical protein